MVVAFSPCMVQYLRQAFRLGAFLHVHPFQWNKGSNLPKVTITKFSRGIWATHAMISASYGLFLISQYLLNKSGVEIARKIYMEFMVLYYAFPPLFHLAIVLRGEELPRYLAQFLSFSRILERKAPAPERLGKSGPIRKCEMLFRVVFYGFFSNAGIIACQNLIFPTSHEFLSSLTANPRAWNVRILSCSFQLYYIWTYICLDFLYIFSLAGSIFGCLSVLLDLNMDRRTFSKDIVAIYTMLQIVTKELNHVFLPLMTGGIVLLILFAIYCTFGALRLEGIIALSMALVGLDCTALLLVILDGFSELNSRSKSWLRRMRRLERPCPGFVLKGIEALRPIQIFVGNFYVVDKLFVALVLHVILSHTINLLVIE